MNGNLSPLSTKIQPVENAGWIADLKYSCNSKSQYRCLKGELIDSAIWVAKPDRNQNERCCTIRIKGDFDALKTPIMQIGNGSIVWVGKGEKACFDYVFTFQVSDEKSERFLDCINLVDKKSPLGKETLSAISKLVAGYSTEGNAKIDFLPMFVFFMALKYGTPFTKELIILIF